MEQSTYTVPIHDLNVQNHDEWELQQLNALRTVIDFVLQHLTPQLVNSIYERFVWINKQINDVLDGGDDSYRIHHFSVSDAIGLVSERLELIGVIPHMDHPALSPLMDLVEEGDDWKHLATALERWTDLGRDLDHIKTVLQGKCEKRKPYRDW